MSPDAISAAASDAREILDMLWAFLLVGLGLFFRLLQLKGWLGQSPLLNPPAVWFVTAAPLLFFFYFSLPHILSLMWEDYAWGVLAGIVILGILALMGLAEIIHRQNYRYVDLLTDADPAVTAARASRESATLKLLQMAAMVWLVLFAMWVSWLWKIAHSA